MKDDEKYIARIKKQFKKSFSDKNALGLLDVINPVEKHQNKMDVNDDHIAEAHKIIANYYSRENDLSEHFHIIKAIKYRPEDLNLRKESLSLLDHFLEECNEKLTVNDLEIFEKELNLYSRYCSMKWGKNENLFYSIIFVYGRIQTLKTSASKDTTGPFWPFCKKWQTITRKYRPIEQAYDYASQIIYEYTFSRKL